MIEPTAVTKRVREILSYGAGNNDEDNKRTGYQAFVRTQMTNRLLDIATKEAKIGPLIDRSNKKTLLLRSLLQKTLAAAYQSGGCDDSTAVSLFTAFEIWPRLKKATIVCIAGTDETLNCLVVQTEENQYVVIDAWQNVTIVCKSQAEIDKQLQALAQKAHVGKIKSIYKEDITQKDYADNFEDMVNFLDVLNKSNFATADKVERAYHVFLTYFESLPFIKVLCPHSIESPEFEQIIIQFMEESGDYEKQAVHIKRAIQNAKMHLSKQQPLKKEVKERTIPAPQSSSESIVSRLSPKEKNDKKPASKNANEPAASSSIAKRSSQSTATERFRFFEYLNERDIAAVALVDRRRRQEVSEYRAAKK